MNIVLDFLFLSIPEGILFAYILRVLINKNISRGNIAIAGILNAVGLETIRLLTEGQDLAVILFPQIALLVVVFLAYYRLSIWESLISVLILTTSSIVLQVLVYLIFVDNIWVSHIILGFEFLVFVPATWALKTKGIHIKTKGNTRSELLYLLLIQFMIFIIIISINFKIVVSKNELSKSYYVMNFVITTICMLISIYTSLAAAEAIGKRNFENVMLGIGMKEGVKERG
jgi:hypothetical protein